MGKDFWRGERVRLRAVEPGDWEKFFEGSFDSESLRASHELPFPRSQERYKRWTEKLSSQDAEDDAFRWIIDDLEGEMVGTINTFSCDRRHGTFSYGLGVDEGQRRAGYASDAIRLVLRFFFEELRYQKATVHVYSFNEPSIRLHERLGFQPEGRLRSMIYTNGGFHDDLIFGMTAEEFAARYPSDSKAP
ncbi:MAG: GNAT family N-acetyltransferase [Chloroflexia bacterium]